MKPREIVILETEMKSNPSNGLQTNYPIKELKLDIENSQVTVILNPDRYYSKIKDAKYLQHSINIYKNIAQRDEPAFFDISESSNSLLVKFNKDTDFVLLSKFLNHLKVLSPKTLDELDTYKDKYIEILNQQAVNNNVNDIKSLRI